jgi:hypothetical protein
MDRISRVFVIVAVAALMLVLAAWFVTSRTPSWNQISPVGSQGYQYAAVHG